MSPPWSSAPASTLQRDRQRLLVSLIELRALLHQTPAAEFSGGGLERANALEQTEQDYVALVEAGAEAARLEAQLASADREATEREVAAAALVIEQMRELAAGVEERLPRAR